MRGLVHEGCTRGMRGEIRGEYPLIPVPWGGGVPAAAVSRVNPAGLWGEWEDERRRGGEPGRLFPRCTEVFH